MLKNGGLGNHSKKLINILEYIKINIQSFILK